MNILIVDDIATNRKLLSAILEAENHAVIEAVDGVEALEVLKQGKVDAIISDILMPRMDGYRLCYEIRANERFRNLPFIFYTSSYTSPSDEKLALEMGGDKFLTKPAPASKIIQALNEVMSVKRSPFVPIEPSREINLMKEYNQQLVAKLEQKNNELAARNEELMRSEQKLLLQSAALETAANAVVITDIKGIIQWVNPAFVALTGYTSEEALGKTPRLLKSGQHDAEFYKNLWKTILAGKTWRGNFTNCRKDGSLYYDEHTITPVRSKKGVATHFIAIMNDVTERRRAEEQIAEQAALLNKARDAILVRDLEGKILFWNEGAERMYGWAREEVLGRNIGELLYANPKKFEEINGLTIHRGEWHGELQHVTRNRGEITVEARWTLIRDDEGNPKSMLAINTDITEKKKIESQFMRAQRMESIGTLAGGIAHDLNNILAPIMLSIEMLRAKSVDPDAVEILESIEISAKRGADIVRQVLSFARGLDGERVEIQPKHLLRDLEKIIKDTFPKDIRLQFSIPNQIWTLWGDPTQVHQILLNLCVNARDAMPNGGSLTVSIENCVLDEQYAAMNIQAKPGRYINICVMDSGTGIPPGLIDKIFEPFFTTKEMSKGTGLGLSTVAAIVKSHGGVINVYSELGKGTTFKVYLPAMEISDETQKEKLDEADLPRGNGETVLVVDDEVSILTITCQTLQAFGYKVLKATNGAEAVAVYVKHQNKIAIVLTDMMMPVMDGPATVHALMRINPEIKIVAVSGLNVNGGVAKMSGMRVKHFLTKPYTASILLKTLRDILKS